MLGDCPLSQMKYQLNKLTKWISWEWFWLHASSNKIFRMKLYFCLVSIVTRDTGAVVLIISQFSALSTAPGSQNLCVWSDAHENMVKVEWWHLPRLHLALAPHPFVYSAYTHARLYGFVCHTMALLTSAVLTHILASRDMRFSHDFTCMQRLPVRWKK